MLSDHLFGQASRKQKMGKVQTKTKYPTHPHRVPGQSRRVRIPATFQPFRMQPGRKHDVSITKKFKAHFRRKLSEALTSSVRATTHRSLWSISFLETSPSLFLVANHAGIWWPHHS